MQPQTPEPTTIQQQGQPTRNTTTRQTKINKVGPSLLNNKVPGLLEWGSDNRIRLYTVDQAMGQYQLQFNCAPNEVQKLNSNVGIVNIKPLNGKNYYLEMVPGMSGKVIVGHMLFAFLGIIGEAIALYKFYRPALKEESTSDYAWWQSNLAQYGVRSGGITLAGWCTFTKILLIVQVIALAIIIPLFIFAIVMAISSGEL